jgi:hypothetical protein
LSPPGWEHCEPAHGQRGINFYGGKARTRIVRAVDLIQDPFRRGLVFLWRRDVARSPDVCERQGEVSDEVGIVLVVLEPHVVFEVRIVFEDAVLAGLPCAQGAGGAGRKEGVGGGRISRRGGVSDEGRHRRWNTPMPDRLTKILRRNLTTECS